MCVWRCVGGVVVEYVMVIWLAAGGRIEKPADAGYCGRILGLYQSSIATGQSLLLTENGERRVVLDVRCQARAAAPVS